ncbi:MAG: hypothetical protein QOE92_831 [Chloroflexota bacterium]|jgi:branched-chain amino acid transport system substrate-binding protein|nr:hypothetical protein [Chloroflexota bacterium]
MKQSVRDKVAVAFITLSVAFSGLMAVLVVSAYNSNKRPVAVAGGDTGALPADAGGADQVTTSGGSAGGNSGGGGGGAVAKAGKLATSQAESGVTGDTITVGGIFDETNAVDSSVERDTVRAYFNKVNAAGGINGRKLQMIQCDSQYDAVVTRRCASQMVDAHVLSIVGWTAPKGENEQVPYFTQQGIPMIGGLGTPDEYNSPLSYPVSTPFTRYGEGLAARAAELGIKHPAIVAIYDVPWVKPVIKALQDALHAKGIQETHIDQASATQQSYDQDVLALEHQNDLGPCANQPPDPCPDALLPALDPFSYSRLFQAMDRAGWHTKIIGGGLDKGSSQSGYHDQIENANSLVPFLSPYDNPNNPTVKDYLSTVQLYYPGQFQALDIYTQHSWTAAMVFVEALKRAGKDVTRASLVDALNTIKNFDTGWSKPLSYKAEDHHDPNHCFTWTHHDEKDADHGGTWHTISDWQCFDPPF